MLAYIILFCILMLVFLIPQKYFQKYGLVLIMIVFAIFFGIRNNIALDDDNYIEIFSIFSKTLENAITSCPNIEITFKIICRILGILHLNYKSLFLVYSCISFTFLGLFLKKLELDRKKKELLIFTIAFLAVPFFIYMTVMRQFLAITMSLYGMAIVAIDKKYAKGIIFIVISALFHNSTIIALLILPFLVGKFKIDYRIEIALLIIITLLGETGLINSFVFQIFSNSKYSAYLAESTQQISLGSGITHYVFLAIYIIQLIIINRRGDKEDMRDKFLYRGEFVYLFLFFATVNSGFAIRLSYIYLIFLCLLFVEITKKIKDEKIILVTNMLIFIMCLAIIGKNLFEKRNSKFMTNDFSVDFFNQQDISDLD